MITLYMNRFQDSAPERNKEYDECLRKNIDNPYIDRIICVTECGKLQGYTKKVKWIAGERPTYRKYFDLIREHCDSKEYSIISNSDIFFDKSLDQLNGLNMIGTCFALSRWDYEDKTKDFTRMGTADSHDTWIFQGPIRNVRFCDYFLGVWGCDWRIAWEIEMAQYRIANPCETIKAYHMHQSQIRHGRGDAGQGGISFVEPCTLESLNMHLNPECEQRIIAFSLFGDNPVYTIGAIENVKLARHIYPGWVVRFYVDKTVPESILQKLEALGCYIVHMPIGQGRQGAYWRLLVGMDRGYDRWLIRDCDSRLSYRERKAVDEWIASGKAFHVMRDHPWHSAPIMAGLFGGTKLAIPEIKDADYGSYYGAEQNWLQEKVWPRIQNDVLIHDNFPDRENYRFFGEKFDEIEQCHMDSRRAAIRRYYGKA